MGIMGPVWLYIIGIAIIVPLIRLGIAIYHITKHSDTVPVSKTVLNPYEESNMLRSIHEKICMDGYEIDSLSKEECNFLRRKGVL